MSERNPELTKTIYETIGALDASLDGTVFEDDWVNVLLWAAKALRQGADGATNESLRAALHRFNLNPPPSPDSTLDAVSGVVETALDLAIRTSQAYLNDDPTDTSAVAEIVEGGVGWLVLRTTTGQRYRVLVRELKG